MKRQQPVIVEVESSRKASRGLDFATNGELSQLLGTDSVNGVSLGLLGLLWAGVPVEANRGAYLSFRLQRQTVVR